VTSGGDVKLLDFGIAKTVDSSVQTELGTLKGKLAYMTPEQVMGRGIDRRTDVFAVGVMLWELLARRRLWAGVPEPEVVGRLVAGAIPDLTTAKPDAPPELVAICRRALMPKKEERYPTAAEMRRDLDAYARTLGPRAARADVASAMDRLFAEHRRALEQKIADVLSGAVPPPETSTPLLPSTGLPTLVGSTEVMPSGSSTPGTSKTLAGSVRRPPQRRIAALAVVATAVVTFSLVFVVRAIVVDHRAQAGPPDAPSSVALIVPDAQPVTTTPGASSRSERESGVAATSSAPIATLAPPPPSASAKPPPPPWIVRPRPTASAATKRRDPSDLGY
jgi:serine/threonine-protein kinase